MRYVAARFAVGFLLTCLVVLFSATEEVLADQCDATLARKPDSSQCNSLKGCQGWYCEERSDLESLNWKKQAIAVCGRRLLSPNTTEEEFLLRISKEAADSCRQIAAGGAALGRAEGAPDCGVTLGTSLTPCVGSSGQCKCLTGANSCPYSIFVTARISAPSQGVTGFKLSPGATGYTCATGNP